MAIALGMADDAARLKIGARIVSFVAIKVMNMQQVWPFFEPYAAYLAAMICLKSLLARDC